MLPGGHVSRRACRAARMSRSSPGSMAPASRPTIRFVEEFAELGEYFDMPVNTYSAGMRARLAFGTCLAIDFDVYLIDEVTEIGDERFRRNAPPPFASACAAPTSSWRRTTATRSASIATAAPSSPAAGCNCSTTSRAPSSATGACLLEPSPCASAAAARARHAWPPLAPPPAARRRRSAAVAAPAAAAAGAAGSCAGGRLAAAGAAGRRGRPGRRCAAVVHRAGAAADRGRGAPIYFAVAADQYVAEFRFTLNTADPPRFDPLSLLAGNATPFAGGARIADPRPVHDQPGDRRRDRRLPRPAPGCSRRREADWWARLPRPASIEELVHYWKGQVDPFYDPANGTVTVRLRAFAPADALRLAQAVVAASEKLVNDLSLRARRDTLRHAEAELAQAENRLKAVLGDVPRVPRPRGPHRSGADRRGDRADRQPAARRTGQGQRRAGDAQSLYARRCSLGQSTEGAHPVARSRSAHSLGARNDRSGQGALRHAVARSRLVRAARERAANSPRPPTSSALRGLDQTRANADRQRVFIASFIPPSLPEEALYPRRWRSLGTVALMAFALWGIGGL